MIKKVLATAAVAVTAAGMAAAPAVADGHRPGGDSGNGAGSAQVYGNTTTGGYMSPQIGLVQGSLNKPCFGIPIKDIQLPSTTTGTLVPFQDILTQSNYQTCTENSSLHTGDAPLAHLLSNILAYNGANNG